MTAPSSTSSLDTTNPKFKSIFSFYGAKSKIAHLYPLPQHDTIIEPFAGAAAYSLRYADRQVLLGDSDMIVANIWYWLLSGQALDEFDAMAPRDVLVGQRITDLCPNASEGLLRFLQAAANQGTQGANGVHNQITKLGVTAWPRLRTKLAYWLPRIAHWKFFHQPYDYWNNREATWFIDPPYNNGAGRRYREHDVNYAHLSAWADSRQGQVIVCENEGADWLDFQPLVRRRGVKSSYQKSNAMEVLYARPVDAA